MKIEVGKMYRVGGECNETGNVIKITNKFPFCGTTRFQYETISGKMPTVCIEFFDKNSIFAKNLTLFTAEEKVVILRNGTTVTATQYVDGEKCGTGVAKCSPEDEFDFAFGAKLALERLFGEVESAFDWIRFANGEVSVQVNRKTIYDFLENCEKHDFEWGSGKRATKSNPFDTYDNLYRFTKTFIRSLNCEPKENIWISIYEGNLAFETDLPESEVFVW